MTERKLIARKDVKIHLTPLVVCTPSQSELFHLRILLLNVKGATSYADLRTVNRETLKTYTEVCLALDLIEDDEEWKRAMYETISWMMPSRLRLLFARILIHCQPTYPKQLWNEFKVSTSEDFSRRFGPTTAIPKAYDQIEKILLKES